ncbi:MAG: helix-turn-helix transcriptional regulator [Acidobacteriota bacterium]|nr:MAG: helix-turn-helix transcriptional regulator [Acidobacteriota bacterium]
MTPESPLPPQPPPELPDVGRRLAAARLQRGLSQRTVGRRAGIAASYLSRIETGKVQPTFRTVVRIAEALKMPLEEIDAPTPTDEPRQGVCPVSASGHCLLDLIRTEIADEDSADGELYTTRHVRMLRRFAAWLQSAGADRLRAMEIVLDELLTAADQRTEATTASSSSQPSDPSRRPGRRRTRRGRSRRRT